jgi:hypothetical protein
MGTRNDLLNNLHAELVSMANLQALVDSAERESTFPQKSATKVNSWHWPLPMEKRKPQATEH